MYADWILNSWFMSDAEYGDLFWLYDGCSGPIWYVWGTRLEGATKGEFSVSPP